MTGVIRRSGVRRRSGRLGRLRLAERPFPDDRASRALKHAWAAVELSQGNAVVRAEAGSSELVDELFGGEKALRLTGELGEDERLAGDGRDTVGERVA